MGRIEERLRELGLTLPPTPRPLANYVPAKRVGPFAFVSGQPSGTSDRQVTGQLGTDCTVEDGQEATRLSLLNGLAALLTVVDSLDRVVQMVRIDGLLNSAPGFNEQSAVMNGASDLAVAIFGDAGRHARSGAGVVGLPNNFTSSVSLLVEVE
jgi:enamine deaminase RidA (YjgF/YER057c/UK114 family)